MGGQARAPAGTELAGRVPEPGPPLDQQYTPLSADADPDRAWIEEGLRRALALATTAELSALVALLAVESDCLDSVAEWLSTLIADEIDRRAAGSPPRPQAP